MKILKTILLFIIFLIPFITFTQNNEKEWSTSIHAVQVTLYSIDELNSINWDDMVSVFSDNTPKDSIRMAIELKDIHNYKGGSKDIKIDNLIVAVEGVTADLDKLKGKLKKSTEAMIDVVHKMDE